MDLSEVGSQIRDVTVFRQGAEVVRVAELTAPYPEWIQLGDLPLSLEDDSLRARVVSEGDGAPPLAADLRVELQVTPADHQEPLTREAQERLKQIEREEHRLNARSDYLRRCFERLSALEPRPRSGGAGEAPPASPLESRRELIEFRQRELGRLHVQGRELDEELAQLARERDGLLKKGPQGTAALAKRVLVRLKTPAGAAPQARLELSYRTPGARWAPAYAFRLDRDLTMVDVLMRVVVCQATGEDWNRVRMSVSTADPLAWKELPELPSWRIGKRQPAPAKAGWRPAPADTQTLFADFDRARKVAPAVVTPAPVTAEPRPEEFAHLFGAPEENWLESADPFSTEPAPSAAVASDLLTDRSFSPRVESPGPARSARAGLMRAGGSVRAGAASVSKPMLQRAPGPVKERRVSAGRPDYLGSPNWNAEPAQLEVGREHLSYGCLRMPGPFEPGRGKLRPQDLVDDALDQLRRRGEESSVNLRQVLQTAQHNARAVAQLTLLPGHRSPEAVGGFDYLYPGDGLVDLPSDAQFHSLPLLVRSLPARSEFVTVPRITPEVYRVVEIDCLPDLALPLGPADVYVGDDFLIATLLQDTPPGGTIRLGLGVEQQLKVARNVTYKESTAGMMGGTTQLRHTLTIDLNNRLDREARVQVQERLPEPARGQEGVLVKVEEVTPNWESFVPPERPELKSGYRWQVKVEPRSRLSLKVTYLIEIPSKQELHGGNRREA